MVLCFILVLLVSCSNEQSLEKNVQPESRVIFDFASITDDDGKIAFSWKTAEQIEYVNVSVIKGSTVLILNERLNSNEYYFKLDDTDTVYHFEFTPYSEGKALKSEECTRFLVSDKTALGLPRLTINTKENVFPSCDYKLPDYGPGSVIINDEYVKAIIELTDKKGDKLYSSIDHLEPEDYFDGAKLKVRGNTSAFEDKKPYKIKLDKKVDLLKDLIGRDDSKYNDKEWVLLKGEGLTLNTTVGKAVGEFVGMEWQPELAFVDLYLNGDYRGVYILMEGVKASESRVAIDDDGFLIERDYYYWNEDAYFTTSNMNNYTFKYPEFESNSEILPWIKDIVEDFENSLNYKDNRFEQYVDARSFAAWILGHDYLATGDSLGCNMYVYKKDSSNHSKMKMGPMWDFDMIYWTDYFSALHETDFFVFKKLFRNYYFRNYYVEIFNKTKDGILDYVLESISKLDLAAIDASRKFEAYRWDADYVSVEDNLKFIEQWFKQRINWMEKKIIKNKQF